MSIEKGREYLKQFGIEDRVREFSVSSATVELAAQALGVEGARIAKTLSFKDGDGCILISEMAKLLTRKMRMPDGNSYDLWDAIMTICKWVLTQAPLINDDEPLIDNRVRTGKFIGKKNK